LKDILLLILQARGSNTSALRMPPGAEVENQMTR